MASDASNLTEIPYNGAAGRLIDAMRDAIKRLTAKSKDFKSQVRQLQKENSSLREQLADKEEEISSLRQQLECCRLGLTLRGASTDAGYKPEDAKKQISRIVREIDECLALLKQ